MQSLTCTAGGANCNDVSRSEVQNCTKLCWETRSSYLTMSYFALFVCVFVCRCIYWVAFVWAMLNLYFSHCQASTLVTDMADLFLRFPLTLSALITAGFHCLPALSPGPGLFQFSWQQDASVWGLPSMFVSQHKPAVRKQKSSIKIKPIQYANSEVTHLYWKPMRSLWLHFLWLCHSLFLCA